MGELTPAPGATDFDVELGHLDAAQWHAAADGFDDLSLHQTWNYGAHRRGARHLFHAIVRRAGTPVAAAQVVLLQVAGSRRGLAHVKSGPLWRPSGCAPDPQAYRSILMALRAEVVERRGMLLRLKPWEVPEQTRSAQTVRADAGFRQAAHLLPYDTFVLDLSHSLEELRNGLERKWRRDLRRAMERGFELEERCDHEAIDVFLELYAQMRERKRFNDFSDADRLHDYLRDLAPAHRPRIMLCHYQGRPVSGIVFSHVGDTALALFGAASGEGLRLGASHAVNWGVIEALKRRPQCRWYDLVGGTAKEGIRHFKAGIVKRCGMRTQMYDYDLCSSTASRLLVHGADRGRWALRNFADAIRR